MIKDNIGKLRERINSACQKAGRPAESITLVAVSKGRSAEEIREALDTGIVDIGENRVQEATSKYKLLSTNDQRPTTIRWHMVGHLQSNKVKDALRFFDLIQSVDSLRLAIEINKEAARINKVQDILLEVKTSPEATKFGLSPEETGSVIGEISTLKNIRVCGLMTIAPLADDPEKSRPYFRQLKELSGIIYQRPTTNDQRPILSMGMTDDFEVAIEEGATMIRVGRAIYE